MYVVYVCGPMTSDTHGSAYKIERNCQRAERVSLRIWKAGGVAICPHTLTRHFVGEMPHDKWILGDKQLILRSDVVYAMPGWSASRGSIEEVRFAKAAGIHVCFSLDTLLRSLRTYSNDSPTKQLSSPTSVAIAEG